jgi:copper ion binding protein
MIYPAGVYVKFRGRRYPMPDDRRLESHTMTTITVTAPDISCGNCVAHIEKDLNALEGVQSVKAEVDSKLVTISYDEAKLSREQIAEAMDEAGYPIQ